MNWSDFELGFWTTFGPHGGETPEQILERKDAEIASTGWTFWSFQHRTRSSIQNWANAIEVAKPKAVYVVCSKSPGAKDGQGAVRGCTEFLSPHSVLWEPIPPTIKIPHPFNRTNSATAFVVKSIVRPEKLEQPSFAVEWFSENAWRADKVPTLGVYLIKPGGQFPLRNVGAVLELQPPYVVSVRADN